MARKPKTYQTSLGFFDQGIATKAALAAWGADSNLFYQRAAEEFKDAATSRSSDRQGEGRTQLVLLLLPTGARAFSNAARSASRAPAMLACSGSA